tara:strand:- start:7113 stop:7385 length:273 start_codon:yes stop_codon:yes gene_type:complete
MVLDNNCKEDDVLLAIDCNIIGFYQEELKILMVKRDFELAKSKWSLVGGFLKKEKDMSSSKKKLYYLSSMKINIKKKVEEGFILNYKKST